MSISTGDGSRPATKNSPTLIRRPLDHCPGCNSWQLKPVVSIGGESVHFLCGSCNRCWLVELGYVRRVQPAICEGCPQRQRCSDEYAHDHASA